jgi:nucleotide-binding universal stress UspA family protein
MKFMVGYNDSPAAQRALLLACRAAKNAREALIYVVASQESGSEKAMADTAYLEEKLQSARDYLKKEKVPCETLLLARGLDPGEDLVKFAVDNGVDHIFLGIEKKSRTKKILLGSTAQFVILKGPCPVTTTK